MATSSGTAAVKTADLTLFLPCAGGVEGYLADEVHGLTGLTGHDLLVERGGVRVRGDWAAVMRLNLHSRLAQRVLIELAHGPYRDEHDLYALAAEVPWEQWFQARQTFRVDLTAQASPLKSLNFATLRVKDAVADRFRNFAGGVRPSIDTQHPQVRIHAHLSATHASVSIDTSGEPLFKRGWRQDKGDAPLKETLAAAMLAASGWWEPAARRVSELPLYDPCCGSGTIAIEAAQLVLAARAALRSSSCARSRHARGRGSRPKHAKALGAPAPSRSSAAMWRTAWSTLPSATPSARVSAKPCSCAAAMRCNACPPRRRRASC